jgi:hypothetical protein
MFSFLRKKKHLKLSSACRDRIAALFRATEVAQAEELLEHCTDNPALLADLAQQGADRLLFAMIRFSDGDLDRLRSAISQFQRDWRNLLVASDFDDPHSHNAWQPRRLVSETVDRWKAGDLPTGVKFGPNGQVQIRFGARRGTAGKVSALLGLEPRPRYLVELSTGDAIEVDQYSLQEAG